MRKSIHSVTTKILSINEENNKLKQDEMIPTTKKLNTMLTRKLSFIRSNFIKKFVKFNICSNYTLYFMSFKAFMYYKL